MTEPDPGTEPSSPQPPMTLGRVFRLWWPLAGSWLLMGIELPMFAAVMARMDDPKIHLAAFSAIVFPLALVIEGPIMMLLTASTALARDSDSYRKLYRFMMAAGAVLTAIHVLIAFTPLYGLVVSVLNIHPDLVEPARWGVMIMTPWTWAIAHRRFNQGVLIRFDRSKEVWVGTLSRVLTNASILMAGLAWGGVPGIVVGSIGFAVGVLVEMAFVAWRVRAVVRGPLASAPPSEPLRRGPFLRFYFPLALSPILMILVQPIGSAAMNRMPDSLNSLAAWAPVWGLVFITRSVGFAFNEVVVALLGQPGSERALRRFVLILAATTVSLLILVAATPLAELWFDRVSRLGDDLVHISRLAVAFAVLMPGYQALQSWYQGALVHNNRTGVITEAVLVYLLIASALLTVGALTDVYKGIYYTLVSLSVAGLAQTAWLAWRARPSIRALRGT